SVTYDHRLKRMGHPVRSAKPKLQIGGLVVGWVTTSEYPLLYVFGVVKLLPIKACRRAERNGESHEARSRFTARSCLSDYKCCFSLHLLPGIFYRMFSSASVVRLSLPLFHSLHPILQYLNTFPRIMGPILLIRVNSVKCFLEVLQSLVKKPLMCVGHSANSAAVQRFQSICCRYPTL
ncbi:hypothetical protein DL98DRAFT_418410, partial [Cadophora sp. DSE1049]